MVKAVRVLAFCLVSCLFASFAAAQEWTSITDEIEVDYNDNLVRAFVVIKGRDANYGHQSETLKPGINLLTAYIKTLTTGADKKVLGDEMKSRPALAAKIQKVLEDDIGNPMRTERGSYLQETGQFCRYYTFDLKKLLPVVPELNMPKPAGEVQ